ncbi:AzlD domain-containing protein [Marinobacterium stanieri]|uniref:AzlD domain-containing protein n=1 Tax=Marinobacterium stanieri TaxID=49186 RepID=UPI0002557C62|nr:AzlD domain-containing protein [Marinobacterium stanieri]
MIEALILGMTLIVFINRYLFLEPRLPIQPGPRLLNFLSFSIPAVLAAVIAPMIFTKDTLLNLDPLNPYLVGAGTAAVCMRVTGKTLTSVTLSLLVFMTCRHLFTGS